MTMTPFLFIRAKQLKWTAFFLMSAYLFFLFLQPQNELPVISMDGATNTIYAGQDGISLTVNVHQQEKNIGKLVHSLIKNETTATFFVTSSWLKHHPKASKLLVDRAFDIGVLITDPSDKDKIIQEIAAVKKTLASYGKKDIVFLRAADGKEHENLLHVAAAHGYLPVQWSVDLHSQSADSFIKESGKGDIILLNINEDQLVTEKWISILSQKEKLISLSEMIGGDTEIQYIP
jgi:hypothetical protein